MPQILKDSKLSMVTELTQNHKDYVSLVQISDLHIFDDPSHGYGAINPANTLDAGNLILENSAAQSCW